jgi:hypothetical protein
MLMLDLAADLTKPFLKSCEVVSKPRAIYRIAEAWIYLPHLTDWSRSFLSLTGD